MAALSIKERLEKQDDAIQNIRENMFKLTLTDEQLGNKIDAVFEKQQTDTEGIKHANKNNRIAIENLDERLTKIEIEKAKKEGIEQGALQAKTNAKVNTKYYIGILATLLTLIIGFLTIHEFIKKPQSVQQTVIR
jgi:hypothetical protein